MNAMLRKGLLAAPVLALLLWQGVFAVQVFESDLITFTVQRDVVYWGTDGQVPSPESVDAAMAQVDQALALWPGHPDYLALKARLYAWRGQMAPRRSLKDEQFRLASDAMRLSLQQRPANPYSWAQYAEYLAAARVRTGELKQAINKVQALGGGDDKLQQRMQALVR